MDLSSWRTTLTRGALAAAVAALTLTGTAHAAPAAPVLPSGPVVITNHAHTNYLIPDDGAGNAGTYLQVYYRADHPYPRTFQFEPVSGRPGVYHWKSAKTGNCADAKTGEAGASVYLAACSANKSQWWILRYTGEDATRWVLSPFLNEDLAVTGLYGDDNYAPLRELPNANAATASQQWHFTRQ
ncbi:MULTISPECIES: hypothetical protein [unclassified Streptomyces]|uniref:RICIN domain-containing protein n=1 Tax=unclassified Streptomyces TaxID=2593676 RepID=UPI0034192402